jgi:hypothetical protein
VIVGVVKASLAEIKPGSFVGSAAMPQADGSQKARCTSLPSRSAAARAWPYTIPNSFDDQRHRRRHGDRDRGGHAHRQVQEGEEDRGAPDVPIVRYEIGDRSELKPGCTSPPLTR